MHLHVARIAAKLNSSIPIYVHQSQLIRALRNWCASDETPPCCPNRKSMSSTFLCLHWEFANSRYNQAVGSSWLPFPEPSAWPPEQRLNEIFPVVAVGWTVRASLWARHSLIPAIVHSPYSTWKEYDTRTADCGKHIPCDLCSTCNWLELLAFDLEPRTVPLACN